MPDILNNLVPVITQTAAGIRESLSVFGADYDTPDGTAIRDYIHVVDLAKAHANALEEDLKKYIALNIGTGKGYSVLEVVNTFQEITRVELPYKIMDRRVGDIPVIIGDTSLANTVFKWKAEKLLGDMLKDAWNWQKSLL